MKTNKFTIDYFIEKSKSIHGDKYDYSLVEYKNIFTPIKIICPIHGEFIQIPNSHLNGHGCGGCGNLLKGKRQTLSLNDFIQKANIKHENKYDYSTTEYKNSKSKVKIKCLIHGEFYQTPGKHLSGQGCPKCGTEILINSRRSDNNKFIVKAKLIHEDKYGYSLVRYINNSKKVKIICPIHGIWEQKPGGHLNGKGCRKCSGAEKLTTEIFIKKSSDIHDNKYDYSLVDYKGHYSKVIIICPVHNVFEQGAGSHMSGIGCPRCKESKGEKEIFNQLIKKGIIFETQKTFEGCKFKNKLRFDFYLPEHNMCIEYDGEQHFNPIKYYGGQEKFDLIKKKDEIKTKFCKDNGIQLIRIKFSDKINLIF